MTPCLFPGHCEVLDRSAHGLLDEELYAEPAVGAFAFPLSHSMKFGLCADEPPKHSAVLQPFFCLVHFVLSALVGTMPTVKPEKHRVELLKDEAV